MSPIELPPARLVLPKRTKGNRITINWTRRPSIPGTRRHLPPPPIPSHLGHASKVANGLVSSSRCQPLHPQRQENRWTRVQADKETRKGAVVGGGSRCFYGGSLLKVRSRRPMSGDFLPKHAEARRTGCALCVCFVAILRARNVGERKAAGLEGNFLDGRTGPGNRKAAR